MFIVYCSLGLYPVDMFVRRLQSQYYVRQYYVVTVLMVFSVVRLVRQIVTSFQTMHWNLKSHALNTLANL